MAQRTQMLSIRTKPEEKARLIEAAERVGKTVTQFTLDAALEAAASAAPSEGATDGVPNRFREQLVTASSGGTAGYTRAGSVLASIVRHFAPPGVSASAWRSRLKALRALCDDENRDGVEVWFREHFPRCVELVPSRRMERFVDGVFDAHMDGRI